MQVTKIELISANIQPAKHKTLNTKHLSVHCSLNIESR